MREMETKICVTCGDEMPRYSRICPYCQYAKPHVQNQYDHTSSPYLAMMDLRSIVKELLELDETSIYQSVIRWLQFKPLERDYVQLLEIESTFWVISESVKHRFARCDNDLESQLMKFEDILNEELSRRRKRLNVIRNIARCGAICVIVALVAIVLW